MAVAEQKVPKTACSMGRKDVSSSGLPSLLLPCPLCGHRMAITAVTPLGFADDSDSPDFDDVTHTCVQCGTTVIRTIRSVYHHAHTSARSGLGRRAL